MLDFVECKKIIIDPLGLYSYENNLKYLINRTNISADDYVLAKKIIDDNLYLPDYSTLPREIRDLQIVTHKTDTPTIYAVVGNIGSGKSSFVHALGLNNYVDREVVFILEDVYKKICFDSVPILKTAYGFAKYFVKEKVINTVDRARDFLIEFVPSSNEKIDLLSALKRVGYKVIVFFIGTENVGINISRVFLRQDEGSDYVPKEKVKSREQLTKERFSMLLSISDKLYFYDSQPNEFVLCAYWESDKVHRLVDSKCLNRFLSLEE